MGLSVCLHVSLSTCWILDKANKGLLFLGYILNVGYLVPTDILYPGCMYLSATEETPLKLYLSYHSLVLPVPTSQHTESVHDNKDVSHVYFPVFRESTSLALQRAEQRTEIAHWL